MKAEAAAESYSCAMPDLFVPLGQEFGAVCVCQHRDVLLPCSEAELSNAGCCPPEIHMEVLMCALAPGSPNSAQRTVCARAFPCCRIACSLSPLWEESLVVTHNSAFPHQFYDWDQVCLLCATSTCILLSNFLFWAGNPSLCLVQILFCWM